MATETYYQSKIIKSMIADGGTAITGKLKTGEADIQGSYPIECNGINRLATLIVEVKTPTNYDRVMSCLEEVDGLYTIISSTKLKPHEPLQIHKLNNVRKRGGIAMLAHSYEQVKERIKELNR